jgi:hypothetical protein
MMNITYAIAYVSNGHTYHNWSGQIQDSFVTNNYLSQRFESESEAEFCLEKLFRDYHAIKKTEQELSSVDKKHSNFLRFEKKVSPYSDEVIRLHDEVENKKEDFQLEYGIRFQDLNFHTSENHFQIHKQYNYDPDDYRGYP